MSEQEPKLFPYSLDEISEIMEAEDDKRLPELKHLLEREGMKRDKIEASIKAARLRKKVLEEMEPKIENRKKTNPEYSEEEKLIGVYLEEIEPQVRDAVRVMRKKGYNTISSGFWDFEKQAINFEQPIVKILPDELKNELIQNGFGFQDDDLIYFETDGTDLQKIKEKWDSLADMLPDLGQSATKSPFSTL